MTSDDTKGELTLRLVPLPADTNPAGDVFGGWIMSQVDIAGAVLATKIVKQRVVTAYVSSLQFHKPVFVGDLVSCYADVTKFGHTSIHIHVDVYADRGRTNENHVKVTEADLVYVAIDENRRPIPIGDFYIDNIETTSTG